MRRDPVRALVINSGSSSIKLRLYGMTQEILLISGTLERIGEVNSSCIYREYAGSSDVQEHKHDSPVTDHAAGLQQMFAFLQSRDPLNSMQFTRPEP